MDDIKFFRPPIIEQKMVSITIPDKYKNAVMYILTSGVLQLKGDNCTLHFDADGNLRLITHLDKIPPPNLTC